MFSLRINLSVTRLLLLPLIPSQRAIGAPCPCLVLDCVVAALGLYWSAVNQFVHIIGNNLIGVKKSVMSFVAASE